MAEFDHCTFTTERPPLIINMDETALVCHVTDLRGTVVKVSASKQVAIERASLADRRSLYFLSGVHYTRCGSPDPTSSSPLRQ